MRAPIGAILALLLAACATDRSALRNDLAPGAGAGCPPRATVCRPDAPLPAGLRDPVPALPARAMPADELAQHMGLRYEDEQSHVLLADDATRVRIWKDSNEVSVAGRVAHLPGRSQRKGSELIVPATTVSYVQREVAQERRKFQDIYVNHARRTLPVAPLMVPATRPSRPTPFSLPEPSPARPAPARLEAAGDPGWARHAMPSRAWRWIVIHHSDDRSGNLARYDEIHRTSNGWDECGYHFVIGNGTLSGDGQVEVGPRWYKQKHGAHAKGRNNENCYNEQGVGICLVGDFEYGGRPTRAQMDSLVRLCRWLMATHRIPADMVLGHGDCKPTACPGRNFPWFELRRRLAAR